MIIIKRLPVGRVQRSSLVQSVRKRTMTVFAPVILALVCAPAVTGAIMSLMLFAPCGDTPGFCPQ
jgi:hypothetical protein